jgi:hypothetical protein
VSWREKDHPRDADGRFTESWAGAISDQMGGARWFPHYRAGRDLTASGYTAQHSDEYRQMLRTWAEQGWPHGDPIQRDLAREQGFDGLPGSGNEQDLDEAIAAGGIEIWRGYGPIFTAEDQRRPMAPDERGEPFDRAKRAQDQWRAGEYTAGNGVYGQGTYTSDTLEAARTFGVWGSRYGYRNEDEGDESYAQRMVLSPHARVYYYGTDPTIEAWSKASHGDGMQDPGRVLMARGYDAMKVPAGEDDGTGVDAAQYVIFNRTALIVQERE